MGDVFSRILARHTEAELLARENDVREHLKVASIPVDDVDDYLIAINVLGDIAKAKVLEYAMKAAAEQQAG